MKQKIEIPIKNIVIKKKDLEDIAKYIFSFADDGEVEYFIKFNNDIEIASENLEWINDRKIQEYEIKQIKMSFNSFDYKKQIHIQIYNYDMWGFSSIEINADEENWLGQVEFKMKELMLFCDNKNNIIKFLRRYEIIPIIFILIFSIISNLFWIIFLNKVTSSEIGQFQSCAWFIDFIILYSILITKLNKAFPSIELDISNKTNKSKKIRTIITGIITAIVLPIIVNIIYDFIK